jgi:curved DNA-binding protein CbpA
MNDELTECYDLLGLSPGASPEELKVAYRDLAKVWHPDRFLHDPRLQEKAQAKLKEINEAYDQLRSGKAKRQTQPPAWTSERQTPEHFDPRAKAHAQSGSVAMEQRIPWQLILASLVIFAVVFLVTSRSLLHRSEREDQSQVPGASSLGDTSANEAPHGKDRIEPKSQRAESGNASTSEPSAAPLPPLPTVTIVIDPSTGMIARPDCPVKIRMTYPSGNEPHQYCNLHLPAPTPPAAASGPKDSRLKSAAKRLASPGKWFGGSEKSDGGNNQDPKTP